jgi:hypothetical protein
MICCYCKCNIDDDSFHCDQCGKELSVCPNCGKTGKGKNCVEDGSKLFSPKQKLANTYQIKIQPLNNLDLESQPISILSQSVTPNIHSESSNDDFSNPVLKISNYHLKIEIDIKNCDIVGRTKGNHASLFNQFSQISGQHAQFIFDKSKGWTFIDLGSTNGSAINNTPNWQNVPKLKPHTIEALSNNCFLLIANIEFQIKIISNPTTSETQRL